VANANDSSASQPFRFRGPLFAETLILGPLHEKFVSELMTKRNYCVISEHFAPHLKERRGPPVEKRWTTGCYKNLSLLCNLQYTLFNQSKI